MLGKATFEERIRFHKTGEPPAYKTVAEIKGNFINVQAVSITTKVVSSILAHGEVYSIQLNGIKCVSDF
jgi:hypothetical protein